MFCCRKRSFATATPSLTTRTPRVPAAWIEADCREVSRHAPVRRLSGGMFARGRAAVFADQTGKTQGHRRQAGTPRACPRPANEYARSDPEAGAPARRARLDVGHAAASRAGLLLCFQSG